MQEFKRSDAHRFRRESFLSHTQLAVSAAKIDDELFRRYVNKNNRDLELGSVNAHLTEVPP